MEFVETETDIYIKDACASCGTHMERKWERYIKFGNFCRKCSAESSKKGEARRGPLLNTTQW